MSKTIARRAALVRIASAAVGLFSVNVWQLGGGSSMQSVTATVSKTSGNASTASPELYDLVKQSGFTDLAGIHDEYLKATTLWPFSFPAGYRFPTNSSLFDEADDAAMWEHGNGVAEAYFVWSRLVAHAAYVAYERGDHEAANNLLHSLVETYEDAAISSLIEDPDGDYVAAIVGPALRDGDFVNLREFYDFESLAASAELAEIARAAGDL